MVDSTGQCPKCTADNPYTALNCGMCGARLPWASAVSSVGKTTVPKASTPTTASPSAPPMAPATILQPAYQPAPYASGMPVYCSSCGAPNEPEAAYCRGCGHVMTTQNNFLPPANLPTSFAPPVHAPYPYAPQQHVNVQVTQKNSSGSWLFATLLLIFFTPVGCVAWPVALIALALFWPFAPMFLSVLVASGISKSSLPDDQKKIGIGISLVGGMILSGILLALIYTPASH